VVFVGVRLALVLLVALLVSACGDEYPLDPTPCDDWCHAVERQACGYGQPAECVAGCESEEFDPEDGLCLELWEATISCYSALSDEAMCVYSMGGYETSPRATCDHASLLYMECHRSNGADAVGPLPPEAIP
jgi:hypothetical protein